MGARTPDFLGAESSVVGLISEDLAYGKHHPSMIFNNMSCRMYKLCINVIARLNLFDHIQDCLCIPSPLDHIGSIFWPFPNTVNYSQTYRPSKYIDSI